jgi:hypothetical protein
MQWIFWLWRIVKKYEHSWGLHPPPRCASPKGNTPCTGCVITAPAHIPSFHQEKEFYKADCMSINEMFVPWEKNFGKYRMPTYLHL